MTSIKGRMVSFFTLIMTLCFSTNVYSYIDSMCNSCSEPKMPYFFVDADYIYWTARQDGLKFAFTGQPPVSETSFPCGKAHNLNWDWSSGFKVGAGMGNLGCHGELYVQYTYLNTSPNGKTPIDDTLRSYWQLNQFFNVNHASAKWDCRFRNIDLLFRERLCISPCFTIVPSFGLKGSWIKQEYCVDFVNTSDDLYVMKHKQDFWGIGPKFALLASKKICGSFRLYGNLGASILWSKFDLNRKDRFDTDERACVNSETHYGQPVLESTLGLTWDKIFCCGDYAFWLNLAWEQQLWFDHDYLIHINDSNNQAHGNLCLQGVTAGLGFSF